MERSLATPSRADLGRTAESGLRVQLSRLSVDLGCERPAGETFEALTGDRWPPIAMPEPADAELLAELRALLAGLAVAHGERLDEDPDKLRDVRAALDSAHLTFRGEILAGNRERLPSLVPTFVYLVALPLVEDAAALGLATRAKASLAYAGGGTSGAPSSANAASMPR